MNRILFISAALYMSNASFLAPLCNYVAFGEDEFLPIGGCKLSRTQERKKFVYHAVDYECNADGTLTKHSYDTIQFCDGEPVSSELVTISADSEETKFQCSLSSCQWSEICTMPGCVTRPNKPDCSSCPTLRQLLRGNAQQKKASDLTCTAQITGECMGSSKMPRMLSCDSKNGADSLIQNEFFGHCRNHFIKPDQKLSGCSGQGLLVANCKADEMMFSGFSDMLRVDNEDEDEESDSFKTEETDKPKGLIHLNFPEGVSLLDLVLICSNVITVAFCVNLCFCYLCHLKRQRFVVNGAGYSKANGIIMDAEDMEV